MWKRLLRALVLSLAVGAALRPAVAHAVIYSEVIDGAECIPYPNQSSAGFAYKHWLYMFGQSAYCHLRMTTDWPLANLSYVLYEAFTSSGTVSARLCVQAGDFASACGPPATIGSGGIGVNWVAMPATTMPYASNAYLEFTFPSGAVSAIFQVIPTWWK